MSEALAVISKTAAQLSTAAYGPSHGILTLLHALPLQPVSSARFLTTDSFPTALPEFSFMAPAPGFTALR